LRFSIHKSSFISFKKSFLNNISSLFSTATPFLSLALAGLELVGEGELGSLLLQLGELVLVLGHLLEGGLDELASHVTHGDGELVDLQIAEDDLALEEEHLSLEAVPLVEVGLADLLEVVRGGILHVGLDATALGDDTETLLGLELLLLLELLRSFLAEQSPQLLLTLGGHETLLLTHDGGGVERSGQKTARPSTLDSYLNVSLLPVQ